MSDSIIPFGPLKTGQASNTIEDASSTVAANISMINDIGEINSYGPFVHISYPSAITSAYDYYGEQFVQCGLALYKDGVQIFSLSTADKLTYLPTVNSAGTSYLIIMNEGGNYKYIEGGIEGITSIGIDSPVNPPVPRIDIDYFGLVFTSPDKNTYKFVKNTLDPFIKNTSKPRFGKIEDFLNQQRFFITHHFGNGIPYTIADRQNLLSQVSNIGDIPLNLEVKAYTMNTNVDRFKFTFSLNSSAVDTLQGLTMTEYPKRSTSNFRLYFLKKHSQGGPTNYDYDYLVDNNDVLGYVDTSVAGVNSLNPNGINSWDFALTDIIGTFNWNDLYCIHIAISLNEYLNHGIIYDGAGYSRSYINNINSTYAITDLRFYDSSSIGVLDDTPRFYIYTYEDTDSSVESIASPVSIGNGVRTLNGKIRIDVEASTDPTVDNIRLYRLAQEQYKLVTSIANATTTIEDNVLDSALTDIYSGDTHTPPSTPTLKGSTELKGRIWGFYDNKVAYSEINDPESWGLPPNEIQIGDNSNILTIAAVRDNIYVFKHNVSALYIINTSIGPPFTTTDVKLKFQCISNTVIPTDGGVYYLSTEGIIFFNGFQESNISIDVRDLFNGVASNLYRVGSKLYCTNPQLVFDLDLGYITAMNIPNLSYIFGNKYTSICTTNGDIYTEDQLGVLYPFDMDYKTKNFQFGKPGHWKHIRELTVETDISEGGVVTMEIYADDKLKKTKILKNGFNWMRMKVKGRSLSFRFRGTGKVKVKTPVTAFHEDAKKQ